MKRPNTQSQGPRVPHPHQRSLAVMGAVSGTQGAGLPKGGSARGMPDTEGSASGADASGPASRGASKGIGFGTAVAKGLGDPLSLGSDVQLAVTPFKADSLSTAEAWQKEVEAHLASAPVNGVAVLIVDRPPPGGECLAGAR